MQEGARERLGVEGDAPGALSSSWSLLVREESGLAAEGEVGLVIGNSTPPQVLSGTLDKGRWIPEELQEQTLETPSQAWLWLHPQGHLPQLRFIALNDGEHLVQLYDEGILNGQVILRGRDGVVKAPKLQDQVRMEFHSDQGLFAEDPRLGPVLAALGKEHVGDIVVAPSMDEQGRFSLRGLPADWSGKLYVNAPGYRLQDADYDDEARPFLQLAAPAQGLTLTLGQMQRVEGRILTANGAAAIGWASLYVYPAREDVTLYCPLAEDGSFSFSLDVITPRRLDLQLLTAPEGDEIHRWRIRPVPASWQLGDLELPQLRRLPFQILDAKGAPLGGSLALTERPKRRALSGADGLGLLQLPPLDTLVIAHAPGFVPQTRTILADDQALATFQLQPSNRLEVQLIDALGKPMRGSADLPFELNLIQQQGVLQAPAYLLDPFLFGKVSWYSNAGERINGLGLFPSKEGLVVIENVTTTHPLLLSISERDPAGWPGAMTIAPLAPGEHRRVDLPVGLTLRQLEVHVRGPDDRPIPNATVDLSSQHNYLDGITDSLGNLKLEGPIGETYRIEVEAEGMVRYLRENVVVPAEGVPILVPMVEGRSLHFTMRDHSGDVVRGQSFFATGKDRFFYGVVEVEPGLYQVNGLEHEQVTLSLRYQGWTHHWTLMTAQAEHELRLPTTQAVEFQAAQGAQLPLAALVEIRSANAGESSPLALLNWDPKQQRSQAVDFALPPGRYQAVLVQLNSGTRGPHCSKVSVFEIPEQISGLGQDAVLVEMQDL